jgi:hypothetical protein
MLLTVKPLPRPHSVLLLPRQRIRPQPLLRGATKTHRRHVPAPRHLSGRHEILGNEHLFGHHVTD